MKIQLELKSVRDIQVFFDFANFYFYFIKKFNKIAPILTSILKIVLLIFMPTNSPQITINFITNKVNSIIITSAGGDVKVKNLSKVKKIKIFALSKKPDFVKAKSSETNFLIFKA